MFLKQLVVANTTYDTDPDSCNRLTTPSQCRVCI